MRAREIVDLVESVEGVRVVLEEGKDAPAYVRIEGDSFEIHVSKTHLRELARDSICSKEKILNVLIAHEILHIVLDHFHTLFSKGPLYNHFLMNIAADSVVNAMIDEVEECFETFDPLDDERWKGVPLTEEDLSAEDVYSRILRIEPESISHVVLFGSHDCSKGIEESQKLRTLGELLRGRIGFGGKRTFRTSDSNWHRVILSRVWGMLKKPSTSRMSKRYPWMFGTRMGKIVGFLILIDASGSVPEKTLGKAAELCKALSGFSKVRIFSYDTQPYRIAIEDIENARLWGGGGTNLKNVLKKVEIKKREVLVVVTDGLDEFPDDIPKDSYVIVAGKPGPFYEKALKKLGRGRVFLDEGI